MTHSCAICGATVAAVAMRPLGRNDAMVKVCAACDGEPARAIDGPRLGFVPSGGFLSVTDADRGGRRVLGNEEWERLRKIQQAHSMTPAPALTADDRTFIEVKNETHRRRRARSSLPTLKSSRQKKMY